MLEKKFKVRIRRYKENFYVVEYAYYTLIPTYLVVLTWSTWSNSWVEISLPYTEAKNLAQKFKTIQDIKNHYAEQMEWERAYRKEQEEKRQIEYPVNIEQII